MVEALKSFKTPEEIEALEGELLGVNTIPIPVKHGFCKGIYTRQITIPRGTLAIGHSHADECMNIVTSGSASVLVDDQIKLIKGPCCFNSAPLQRKIGFVHEDITWITVHATRETDISSLESKLIIKSDIFRRYEMAQSSVSTEISNCPVDALLEDRLDYFKAIKELGFTHSEVRSITEDLRDQIEFPAGTGGLVYVGSSKLQGNGLFSAFAASNGDVLAPALVKGKRTKAGRFTNHSRFPNSAFVVDINGDVNLIAICDIHANQELTVDYRQAKRESEKAREILNFNTQ